MGFRTLTAVAAIALGSALAMSANAAVVKHTGSLDGDGNHLYQLFGGIGATGLDTPAELDAAQIHGDQYWAIQASGTSASTMVFEITANASNLRFGVFDATNHNVRVELFDGSASPGGGFGSSVALTILADGSVGKNLIDTGVDFGGTSFGYYIQIGDTIFYSDEALNPGNTDQMATFQGNGDLIDIPGFPPDRPFTTNHFMLAWEDILASRSDCDCDYNDLVVLVESVNPVPEPGTLAVLGLGLVGLGVARRRLMKA